MSSSDNKLLLISVRYSPQFAHLLKLFVTLGHPQVLPHPLIFLFSNDHVAQSFAGSILYLTNALIFPPLPHWAT